VQRKHSVPKQPKFDLQELNCRESKTQSLQTNLSPMIDQFCLIHNRIVGFITLNDPSSNKGKTTFFCSFSLQISFNFFISSENRNLSIESNYSPKQQHSQQQQYSQQQTSSSKDLPALGSPHQYWISKWVDFSQKFGLG
jgi:hypothetical protein